MAVGLRREQFDYNTVGPERFTPSYRSQRYFFETFMNPPMCWDPSVSLQTAPGGTSGTEEAFFTGRYTFLYAYIATASDIKVPVLGSEGGYNWALDGDTAADGVEINFGSTLVGHPRTFTPSAENAFLRVLLTSEDASGLDAFVGFRRVATYGQVLSEYSDIVGIRILGDSSSTTGAFTVITNLNNAGSSNYVSTALVQTLEDATMVELEVFWEGRVAKFRINGRRDRTATFTADIGDVFTPICRLVHTTDLAGITKTLAAEGGLVADRQKGSLVSLAGATT